MKTILIVDDSAIMRRNLRSILTGAGYSVVAEAANGEEACRSYERHRPDLVTMDMTMPLMSGNAAVRRIMQMDPGARIIVISSFDQRQALFEALELGAKQYMIKPITGEKLLQAIRSLFEDSAASSVESKPAAEPVTAASLEPFSISNEQGIFRIVLRSGSAERLDSIRTAVQGLLFIKPLKIAFELECASVYAEQLLPELKRLSEPVLAGGGEVLLCCRDSEIAAAAERWLPASAIRRM